MSEHTDDTVVRHGLPHDEVNFLQKPFTPAALASMVREVLDAPDGEVPDGGWPVRAGYPFVVTSS